MPFDNLERAMKLMFAKEKLEEHGWWHGGHDHDGSDSLEGPDGSICIVLALQRAGDSTPKTSSYLAAACGISVEQARDRAAAAGVVPRDTVNWFAPALTEWNKSPGRTQGEVMAAFDGAVVLAIEDRDGRLAATSTEAS